MLGYGMDEHDPDRTRIATVDPLVGTVLDRRYRIEFRLAAGGFGAIYRATHVIQRRPVALKVLHTKLATEPDVIARFRREAQALGALRNEHTITAYDFGETRDGTMYIAMELLQGESLFERFRALGPLPWRRMVAIARQVCSALGEAHAAGIIHRDLKPTNIHLERIGGDPDFVKVLDFGIAKILHGSAIENMDLTRSGQMVGTFDYMAPEQMVGGQVSSQSDIFTVGVLLHEMITGDKPFGDPDTAGEMLTAMMSKPPASVSANSGAPAELDAIVARCLDRDPLKRYKTTAQLSAELQRVLEAEDTKTQLQLHYDVLGDDTVIDNPPDGPVTAPQRAEVDPRTTLPGVAPPERNTPWPLGDPKRPNRTKKR
jgi:serine/threonine-protein kinase